MRTALVPTTSAGLHVRTARIRDLANQAVRQFSKSKLIEHKLMPRTSTFQPVFTGPSTDIRKTLVRLKTMFNRVLEKQVPYVEYAETPFLEIVGREEFRINLVTPPVSLGMTCRDFDATSSIDRRSLSAETLFGKAIARYVRHLQFLCIKHAIPFDFDCNFETRASDRQKTRTREQTRVLSEFVEVQYCASVCATIVYWYNDAFQGDRSFGDFLASRIATVGESDAFSGREWTSRAIVGNAAFGHALEDSDQRRYLVPEKALLYIPHILRVLHTLTRKTNYVSSAFSIGAVEGS